MSPSQAFHNHPALYNINSEAMANVATNDVTTQWYAPSSYAFDASFMTPCPSTTGENQPWTQLAKVSAPDNLMSQYSYQFQIPPVQQYQDSFKNATRPRSSPSTFGPSSGNIPWQMTNGLGINGTYPAGTMGQLTPITSTFPPNVFQTYATDEQGIKNEDLPKEEQHSIASSTPEIRQPQPRRPYANIQPDPAGAAAQKRRRDDEEPSDISLSTKRRKRTSSVASADLSEDDRLLVSLKEEQNLPWKDIATRYSAEKGKTVQVAALQMKYKRLREKYRVWTETDVSALKQAYELWEKRKWEIISEKMLDFGIDERWNPKQCARRWQDMEMAAVTMATVAGITPALSHLSTSQFSSPIEAPSHFAWVPLT